MLASKLGELSFVAKCCNVLFEVSSLVRAGLPTESVPMVTRGFKSKANVESSMMMVMVSTMLTMMMMVSTTVVPTREGW